MKKLIAAVIGGTVASTSLVAFAAEKKDDKKAAAPAQAEAKKDAKKDAKK